MRRLLIVVAAAFSAAPAVAQQRIDFILNWVPGGDHAPYYYAKKQGWYAKEGIDLNLEPGKGSALATQKVRSEEHTSELQSPCNIVCRLLLEKKKHLHTSIFWLTEI